MTEFWLISAPGEKTCQQTWEKLHAATTKNNNLAVSSKFNIPDLKVKLHSAAVYEFITKGRTVYLCFPLVEMRYPGSFSGHWHNLKPVLVLSNLQILDNK